MSDLKGKVMANKTAETLKKNIDKILTIWEERVYKEVAASRHQETLALRDSLPEYLNQMVDALSNNIDRTTARMRSDKIDSARTGKRHGEDRAGSRNYTMDQLITEYHILRQVLCDVMEEEDALSPEEREVIVCSIEQAVNDAATEYSDILKAVKERISTTLAHDLRNPIASSKLSADLILRKTPEGDPAIPKLKLIHDNMNRLEKMIVGLLDASRLEAGQSLELELNRFDLDATVRQVVDELSLAYPGCLKVNSDGKFEGYWDENGIRRIIENLFSNAIKYGKENSLITISLSQSADAIELSVHNEGKSIPPEDVPILFEQYRRLKTSQEKMGWGLGLTMVKGMVDSHHGSIFVESSNDKGTTFKINLPKDARDIVEEQFPHAVEKPQEVEQVPQMSKTENHHHQH